MDAATREWLDQAAARSSAQMDTCGAHVVLWDDGMEKEPLPVLQLGFAVVKDLPIILLVREGSAVPKHLQTIATTVHFYNSLGEIKPAILESLKDLGLIK